MMAQTRWWVKVDSQPTNLPEILFQEIGFYVNPFDSLGVVLWLVQWDRDGRIYRRAGLTQALEKALRPSHICPLIGFGILEVLND